MSLNDSTERRAAIGIAIVLVAQLMLILDTTIVNVALPQIDAALGFGAASLAWVVNAYGLAFGGFLLVGGRLGDVYGRLRSFQLGVVLFTGASLVGGLAPNSGWLVAARAVQGFGAALAAPGVLALLTTSPKDEGGRHRAFALFSIVGISGGALGLLAGGLATEYVSWRWTLLVNVPIGVGVLATVSRFVAETPRRRERFDLTGAGLAVAGSVAIVWGLIDAPDHGWTAARTLVALVAGAALIGMLALHERRVTAPLLNPVLLRERPRAGALLVTTMVFGGQFAMFFLGVQYLQNVLGANALEAGAAFLPMTVGILATSRVAPRLVERFGERPLLLVGTTGLIACFAWMASAGESSGYWTAVFGPVLLNGLAAGLTFMPAASLVVSSVAPHEAGAASGILQTMQQLGGAVGLAVIASVYASGAIPGQFVPGFDVALLTCSGFAALGLAAAWLVVPGRARASTLRASRRRPRAFVVDLRMGRTISRSRRDLDLDEDSSSRSAGDPRGRRLGGRGCTARGSRRVRTGSSTYAPLPSLAAAMREELPGVVLDLQGELLTPAQVTRLIDGALDLGLLRPPVHERDLDVAAGRSASRACACARCDPPRAPSQLTGPWGL